MAISSNISWTQASWNPWTGCSKVSPACANCYAESWAKRTGTVKWGPGAPRRRTTPANWKDPLRWDAAAARGQWFRCLQCGHEGIRAKVNRAGLLPCTKNPESCDPLARVVIPRPRVFCASLADWLDDEVPIEWFGDTLRIIRATPSLDWLLLTKRPENFFLRIDELRARSDEDATFDEIEAWAHEWAYESDGPSNVLIGITAENHPCAAERWYDFASIPAQRKFLSMEPLLGAVNLDDLTPIPELAWIIVGGESGPGHRDLSPSHAAQIKDFCDRKDIPFHFKQWSANKPGQNPLWLDGQLQQPGPRAL